MLTPEEGRPTGIAAILIELSNLLQAQANALPSPQRCHRSSATISAAACTRTQTQRMRLAPLPDDGFLVVRKLRRRDHLQPFPRG